MIVLKNYNKYYTETVCLGTFLVSLKKTSKTFIMCVWRFLLQADVRYCIFCLRCIISCGFKFKNLYFKIYDFLFILGGLIFLTKIKQKFVLINVLSVTWRINNFLQKSYISIHHDYKLLSYLHTRTPIRLHHTADI